MLSYTKGKKVSHPDMERALSAEGATEAENTVSVLFAEDNGPQLYNPPNYLVTKPVIAKNLSKVFETLPIHGKPEHGISLNRFNKNKLRTFLAVSDKQFKEIAKACSPELLKTGKEVVIEPDIRDQFLMNVHAEPKALPHDDDDPPTLKVLEKNRERLDDDSENRYLNKTLKYKSVHLIPLEQQARSLTGNPSTSQPAELPPISGPRKPKKSGKNKKKHAKAAKSSTNANFNNSSESAVAANGGAAKSASAATGDVGPPAAIGEAASFAPDEKLEPGSDILIKVRIYKPFDYEHYKNKTDDALASLFYHDLVLTGRNKVADIKDSFICCEKGSTKETSRNGFLFIMNAFYVDYAEKSAEHADSLREWCAAREFGNFPKHDMYECTLDELEYKLGNPDVYIHNTTCEHIIIFSEIRLLNANDPLNFSDYPRITSKSLNQKTPFCYNCVDTNPKWIVSGCTRLPYNMALFCQTCLKKVLYDADGKKVCKFKAYPYKGAEEKK